MVWKVVYEHGHPAGWSDDLGMIADSNQWLEQQLPGWYAWSVDGDAQTTDSVLAWCETNCQGYWQKDNVHHLYFSCQQDATLFKMVWA